MTKTIDLSAILERTIQAVTRAGDYALSVCDSFGDVRFKELRNPQTDADVRTEEMLMQSLGEILPEAGFLVEEHPSKKAIRYNWTIDPIDGTKFYSTHFPVFYCQIALLEESKPILAVIYNPLSKQIFHATKGGGAYLNGKRITLQYDGPLTEAIVNLELGGAKGNAYKENLMLTLARTVHRLIVCSTLLRPYILTNTVQAYLRYYGIDYIHDLAPLDLLVVEAGGVCYTRKIGDINMRIYAHSQTAQEIEQVLGI